MQNDENLIDAAAAAVVLHIHLNTCRRLAKQGELPAVRVGRQWRFAPSALTAPAYELPKARRPTPSSPGGPHEDPLVSDPPHTRSPTPDSRPASTPSPRGRRRRGRDTVQLNLDE
ncbi:helix-turn-helix domain-containing protein [Cellulomonas timonensis]|uniref:helix-turn-helix domain-containing protein n=1 Tax=Cellulomonas timonensis TaxID=1689271 RepID=UPI0009EE1FD8|nr:helix-turn-helix domain-containing protein [Cellulomonas timonensis]